MLIHEWLIYIFLNLTRVSHTVYSRFVHDTSQKLYTICEQPEITRAQNVTPFLVKGDLLLISASVVRVLYCT